MTLWNLIPILFPYFQLATPILHLSNIWQCGCDYLIMDATLIEHQLFQEKDVARKSVEGQKSNFWAI